MKELRYIVELLFILALWVGAFYIAEYHHWSAGWMIVPLLVTLGYKSD